jgi:hypothetical protein
VNLLQILAAIILAGFVACANAQINVVSVNDGTGSLVSIPIPGGNGLSVTVGTGTAAQPLENLYNNPAATQVNIGDDDNVQVPLPFAFSFFGQTFTSSWMHSNGVLSFQNPGITGGFCCSGIDLSTLTDSRYNYSIMPLWTDLININGSQYYRTTGNSATYGWYNVSEFYNAQSLNSFEVNITSSGAINTRLGGAMISAGRLVTSGMTGNLAAGEYFQYYHGSGLQINPGNPVSWSALDGTGSGNMCYINPLSDPTCPGYQQAYLNQQCTISALWDPTCPGYQQAYFTQQCAINPLYSSMCPGYETAYFNQQCSINTLYSVNCPGYAAAYLEQQCTLDPLYSTTCDGYAQAYFDQQCLLNGLYSNQCPNYATAYATTNLLTTTNSTTTSSGTVLAQITADPVAQAAPLVSDPIVNSVITTRPATNADANPAAPVRLTAPAATAQDSVKDEKKTESKSNNTQSSAAENKSTSKPQTARESLAEKQREKAKKEAVAKGKDLANEMGKAADMAAQVEVQNIVIQAMGFTPGFDTYSRAVPDTQFYKPYEAYPGQRNVDSGAGRRLFGGSDSVHQEMVDKQYNLGK